MILSNATGLSGNTNENKYFGNNPVMATFRENAIVLLEFDVGVLSASNPGCLELTVKAGGGTGVSPYRNFVLKQPTADNLPTPANEKLKWSNDALQTLIHDSTVVSTKNVHPAPVGGDKIYFDITAGPVGDKYTLFLLADDDTRTDFSTSNDDPTISSVNWPKLLFGDDCPSS
jgi:hypothetical protein